MKCLMVVCGAFMSSPPCAPAADTALQDGSAAVLCKKGRTAMKRGSLDEALGYFTAASSAGMPKDSLYYFLSTICFAKGAYDTALAFNFGMKPATRNLIADQLEQRCIIYRTLGWKKDAELVMDSLMTMHRVRQRPYVPDVGIRLGADYAERRETDQLEFPFDGPIEPQYYKGPGYNGNAEVRWQFPAGRRLLLHSGLKGTLTSKFYRTSMSQDSVNRAVSANASLEDAPSGISLNYALWRSIDFSGRYTTTNNISLSHSKIHMNWMTYLSGGYDVETGAGLARENRRFWAVGYADQTAIASRGWTFQLMASRYDAAPVKLSYDTSNMYFPDYANVMYVDDVHSSPAVHYRSAASSDTLPRNYLGYILNSDSNMAMLDFRTYAQRQISIEPSAKYTLPLPFAFTASASCGTSVTYYTEPFCWLTTADPDGALPFGGVPIIVFSEKDRNYYWYMPPVQTSMSTFTEVFGGSPVNREKYRTDLTIELSFTLKRPIWRLGTLEFCLDASKTYSTLRKLRILSWQISREDAPFAVPDRSWSAGITWIYDFSGD